MATLEPVHLQEDEQTGDRFLLYGTENGVKIELRYEGDTLWLTQPQIAELFGVTRQSVNAHLNNIYEEGELDREATCKEILQVRDEGGRAVTRRTLIHNLDAIIAAGYRVSTKQGTLFRRWATDKLVQFATRGFVIDTLRLKNPDYQDRVAELREIVRDIRADEANVYRELKQICSMCQDYDGASDEWQTFYRNTQAKLVYAVCSSTPAEVIRTRADAAEANMGLQSWPNDNIRKADVGVSKNYLAPAEIRELNRLTTILLDIFEDQMDVGRLKLMSEAAQLLDNQLSNLGRVVLRSGGRVSMTEAKHFAERQYESFKAQQKAIRHAQADEAIAKLKQEQKALPKHRPSRS
ncbi:RhuM family protein [uncultured Sphingomonas sp.]|uniref:RhuM family protein n=1 Tax=uncultured Sphingomonas sp. TaxID=158754 RepID=UPI0025FEF09D|nr:RhuM family protein [uncultured Sphingomonas sp.]